MSVFSVRRRHHWSVFDDADKNCCRPSQFASWQLYTHIGLHDITSSSAVAKRPRDASCLSVVSFNSTKRRVESFIVKLRTLQIYHCVQLNALFCCLWRNVEASCQTFRRLLRQSTPPLTIQRCVITCETVAVDRRPCLQHLPVAALTVSSQARYKLTGSESRFLLTPPAFDAPVRGVLVGILLYRLAWKN